MKKIRVGILFGGRSAEHEVSLQSAKNIFEAIDKEKYEPIPIGITKKGEWILFKNNSFLADERDPSRIHLLSSGTKVTLTPWKSEKSLIQIDDITHVIQSLDVLFPVLHGPFGEDGTIQGLLKLSNIPFVGASVLGSAVGMDKGVMKRLLRDAGIAIGEFREIRDYERETASYSELSSQLGKVLFIKPANLGSSIGVSKVSSEKEFMNAVETAFSFDKKIIVESFIQGREIECAVLGNDHPKASIAGEIIPQEEFYSYDAKYIKENGALLRIPAELPESVLRNIQDLSILTFKTLGCEGMARVDFFLTKEGAVLVNEINTIPGFTKISMYPKLWEASGISYTKLIDSLIELAIGRFEKEQKLKTAY